MLSGLLKFHLHLTVHEHAHLQACFCTSLGQQQMWHTMLHKFLLIALGPVESNEGNFERISVCSLM